MHESGLWRIRLLIINMAKLHSWECHGHFLAKSFPITSASAWSHLLDNYDIRKLYTNIFCHQGLGRKAPGEKILPLYVFTSRFPWPCLFLWVLSWYQLPQRCQTTPCESWPWWWSSLCLWVLLLGHKTWVFFVFHELDGASGGYLRGNWTPSPVEKIKALREDMIKYVPFSSSKSYTQIRRWILSSTIYCLTFLLLWWGTMTK